MTKQYAVVIEKSDTGYGAWAPDLPGCVATAGSVEETLRLMHEAIEMHIESLREHGEPIPEPSTRVDLVAVSA